MFQECVLEIDESNYNEVINKELVVLQFFSDWKMNCLMTLPMVEDIAREFCEKYPELCFGRVNIDEFEELAQKHNIVSVPTILILRNGKVFSRVDGSLQEDFLRNKISEICGSHGLVI
jgi:thioredoxin 1